MSTVCHLPGMVVIGLSLFAAAPLVAQEVPWRHDYNAARKEAKEKNKPLLLDVGMTPCKWCDKLDATTFRDPTIVKALTDNFIPVKVNATTDPQLAQALGIDSFPTLLFAAPNGKIVGQQDGYIEAGPLGHQLSKLVAGGNETNVQSGDRAQGSPKRFTNGQDENREQNDATRLLLAADKLTDALGATYLELAESLLKKGQAEQALTYLEKVVRTCPGTHAAQLAQERTYQVKDKLTRPTVRGQAP